MFWERFIFHHCNVNHCFTKTKCQRSLAENTWNAHVSLVLNYIFFLKQVWEVRLCTYFKHKPRTWKKARHDYRIQQSLNRVESKLEKKQEVLTAQLTIANVRVRCAEHGRAWCHLAAGKSYFLLVCLLFYHSICECLQFGREVMGWLGSYVYSYKSSWLMRNYTFTLLLTQYRTCNWILGAF